MLKRAFTSGAFAGGGFPLLSRVVVRHPLIVIASWIALAGILLLLLPSLPKVVADNPPEFLPTESPVLHASTMMREAFNEPSSDNSVVVILSNEGGLTDADEATYRSLVEKLRADTTNVRTTQDFVNIPELREVMTSKDGKAYNLPVQLVGVMATSEGQTAYKNVVEVVDKATADSDLSANVVGAAATFEDINKIGARDQLLIETTTAILVFSILVLVYRSLVAMLLPMVTIGVSLVVSQQVVAGLGLVGLGVGPQTLLLMVAMLLGAGTDYAIFLLSRYQEILRTGVSSDEALREALVSIGQVIAGSALTVAAAFMGMAFTDLGVFSTVGPPLAITIMIGFFAAVTLLPALMTLAGRRGRLKPRKDLGRRMWRRSGITIVKRPKSALVGSLAVLLGLAACMSLIDYNYDDRKNLPDDAESNMAYEAMNKHFPTSSTAQQFLLVHSPADLRTPKALADLEQMAQRVSDLPGIEIVRGITRPTGEMIEQGKATWQAGEVGSRLLDASTLIDDNDANLSLLTGGADQLADALDEIRRSVVGAVGSVRGLASALDDMSKKFGGEKTLDEIDKTAKLVTNMRQLGKALGFDRVRLGDLGGWAAPMVNALNVSPNCTLDPACVESRADLQRIANLQGDPLLDKIAELGDVLVSTNGDQTIDDTLSSLSKNVTELTTAARDLGLGQPNGVQNRINTAVQGANTLADSSRQLAEGVQLLVDQTRNIGDGLDQASAFLLAMKREAADPPMSGFYIPPELLTQAEFEKAAALFISDDGHTARYLVQTALDPFSVEAMDQLRMIVKTAEDSRANTVLADSTISMVGFTVVNDNLRTYYDGDILFIIAFTLIVVFLILVVLLRAILAPLYLVASVVLSFVSAVGIGVLFFQFILGQNIHWSVPGTAFLVLVAVGADYNLLLISRIRDELHLGLRSAVIRTVGATGGVITSAGIIFAVSMLSLTVSSISTVVQMGFVIGVGLLLDTFIVRTVTVPAMAVLAGNAQWWPSKSVGTMHKPPKRAKKVVPTPDTDTDLQEADFDEDVDTDRLRVEPIDDLVDDDPDTDELNIGAGEDAAETDQLSVEGDSAETDELDTDQLDVVEEDPSDAEVDASDELDNPEPLDEDSAESDVGVVDEGSAESDELSVELGEGAVETDELDVVEGDPSDADTDSEADAGADSTGEADADAEVDNPEALVEDSADSDEVDAAGDSVDTDPEADDDADSAGDGLDETADEVPDGTETDSDVVTEHDDPDDEVAAADDVPSTPARQSVTRRIRRWWRR
ncbi:MAG: MMPL family transporter [Mycobacterium sp.]